jgi:hypothetical protein
MISLKNKVVDIRTLLQISQVCAMLELSKVFNGSETFGKLQVSKVVNKKGRAISDPVPLQLI